MRNRELAQVAAMQDGVVTAAQAAAAGAPLRDVRRMLSTGEWVALSKGAYWVRPQGAPPLRTRVRAALLSCGSRSVAVGPTAAAVHGIEGLPERREVHVAATSNGGRRPGIVLHRLGTRQLMRVRGLIVTTPVQTVADLLLTQGREPAVCALDSALRQKMLPQGVDMVAPLLQGRPGALRARRRLLEADGRAESPLETRNRLICVDGGMPPETLQWSLNDPVTGRRCRVDLGWPSLGVGVEADGRSVHGAPGALYGDRTRQNALLAAHPGLVLLRFTWRDTYEPGEFLTRLRQALGARDHDAVAAKTAYW